MPKILVPEDRTRRIYEFECVLKNPPAGVNVTQGFEVKERFSYFHYDEAFIRHTVSKSKVREVVMQENLMHVGDNSFRVDHVSFLSGDTEETDIEETRHTFSENVFGLDREPVTETVPVIKERMRRREIKHQIYS